MNLEITLQELFMYGKPIRLAIRRILDTTIKMDLDPNSQMFLFFASVDYIFYRLVDCYMGIKLTRESIFKARSRPKRLLEVKFMYNKTFRSLLGALCFTRATATKKRELILEIVSKTMDTLTHQIDLMGRLISPTIMLFRALMQSNIPPDEILSLLIMGLAILLEKVASVVANEVVIINAGRSSDNTPQDTPQNAPKDTIQNPKTSENSSRGQAA